MSNPQTKPCTVCGRTIEWRRKWARDWDAVKFCSAACRKRGIGAVDRQLEEAILTLLEQRASAATICPSEAARQVFGGHWRSEMERTRMAARRLVNAGRIEITQQGRAVDPSTAKGPIRLRRTNTG